MGTLWQDLRFAFRTLRSSPSFTAIAVLTMALGIGANTGLFSIVNGVLLNPLPYPRSEELVSIYDKAPNSQETNVTYPNFLDWQRETRTFASLAAFRQDDFSLTVAGETERLRGEMVSASFFPLFGARPVLGRAFRAEEDRLGAAPVVLISAGLWERRLGSSPEVLDKSITLSGVQYKIVGVIPASFHFDRRNDVYVPLGQWTDKPFRDRRIHSVAAVGRLKPGFVLSQARTEMEDIVRNLAMQYPENRNWRIALVSLKKDIVGDVQSYLLFLLVAVGFVLLIACVNVANLLLARSIGRRREFAVRAALGASRARMIRQLLTETMLLAVCGGGLGLILAVWGTQAALGVLPEALPRADEVGLDARVLIFTLAISLLAGVLFGLAPALRTMNPDLQETLKEGSRGSSWVRHRALGVFVVIEMGLALVLLTGAGLMLRSLALLWNVNPGFNPHHVLTFSLSLPPAVSANPSEARAYLRRLHDTLDAIPGVEASSVSAAALPLSGDFGVLPFWFDGQPKPSGADMNGALWYPVDPEYFKVMQIPLKRGRLLDPRDDENAPFVIVIDEEFARKYFGRQNPIGKGVDFILGFPRAEIVGVVGHVKHFNLDSSGGEPIPEQLYFPFLQFPDQRLPHFARQTTFVVRTQGAPSALVGVIRRTLRQMNSEQVMYDDATMDTIVSNSISSRRFSMILLSAFAALALVLACVGIYGVVAYIVSQRTHELGIRTALGAQRKDLLKLILNDGARIVVVGAALGLLAAVALTRLMARLLYGVSATDPLTFVAVAALLTLVAMAACYVPARRAMRVDPLVALRHE
jgi:predicted permease